jgi:predicted Zn-dependent protease
MSAHRILSKKGIALIPFLLITLFQGSLSAQLHTSFSPELKMAMVKVSEMRFAEARKIVDRARKTDPDNCVPDYLEAAGLCIGLFLNEDQSALKQHQDRIDKITERLEQLPEKDPYRNLFLGEIYVAQAILNGKFRNNLTAAWQFYKAYQYLTSNYEAYPDFYPNYIPLGVLYSAIGSLPEDYRRIASLLGFEGDVNEGMEMLKTAYFQVSRNASLDFYTNYAGFVYSYVSFQLNPSLEVSPRSLKMDLTSSSFLLYLQSRISYEQGKVKEAAHWLDRCPRGDAYAEFYHLYYLQGKYLLGLEPARSRDLILKYLDESPTDLYRKSSWRYLSWYFLMEGKTEDAERCRIKVLTSGSAHTGADRQAELEARKPWNETLVRARILFDAARYQSALQLLLDISVETCCSEPQERAEYYYRLGRIKQELGEPRQAMDAFTKALEVKDAPDSYALGNSALQIALIAEHNKEDDLALSYFRRALRYDQYPFYEGIHQKAKAGVHRLK